MPTFPGTFQLGILLHCFVTFSALLRTLSWRCLSFFSSFVKVFSRSAAWLYSFTTLQISLQNILVSSAFVTSFGLTPPPLNSAYILLLIKINDSILSELFDSLLISSYFITFFKQFWIHFLNHFLGFTSTLFLSLCIFDLVHSICFFFFFISSSSLDSLSINLNSCNSLFISPSILRFYLGSFFFRFSDFFSPIHSATNTTASLNKLLVSAMLLLFGYVVTLLTLPV